MRRLLVAAALLVATLVAPPAHAGWKIDRAQQIADTVWHRPCGGHLRMAWDVPITTEYEAAADLETCTIEFAPRDDPWSFDEFCTTVLHEAGHLAGFRDPLNTEDPYHSHRPGSVMAARTVVIVDTVTIGRTTTTEYVGTDRRCRDHGRPFLVAHGITLEAHRPDPQPAVLGRDRP